MDALFRKSDRLLANTQMEIVRDKMNDNWNPARDVRHR